MFWPIPRHVTGLDPDAAALNLALLRRDPHVTGVRGDVDALSFADATFNATVAMTCLCFRARSRAGPFRAMTTSVCRR